ncbi:alpha/beta hydrolase [Psychromonas ossibalaenae]|uniref:alpha/beta hydrolase n=1 Tax=Psychromonas ossibalaenae TaxID=444922 RepID=UPI000371882D|nr:alpha/beta hydrolase [Psychromonas ossibalaenae]
MKSTLASILLIYIVFCLLLLVMQRKFLYFPQPAGPVSGVTEISFLTGGVQLNGWVVNKGMQKALIYYGGNAESIESNITFFETQLPNYSVYLIAYRGYGNSTGHPSEAHLYHDALYVFDQIKVKHKQISLMGRSLGSGVATYVAANRQVEKLLLVTPYDSIENVAKSVYWMFPVSLFIKDNFQSIERVKNISAQTYIFTAENDQVIPRARSEPLIAQFTEQLVDSILVSGADHNDISLYPEYIAGVRRALE